MPEGHAIHRLGHQLEQTFGGQKIASTSPQGRFDAHAVDGQEFGSVNVWGKHLVIGFATLAEVVHVHLGIFGRWSISTQPDPPETGTIRWRLLGDGATADLRGPMACELLLPPELDNLVARLGTDPLRSDADGHAAGERIRRSRAPIATLLMDQSVIAGAGNIFRAEVLFRHGIDPFMPGQRIDENDWQRIWDDLAFLMHQAVDRGRIDTVRPHHEPDVMGRPPRVDEHGGEVYVYRRAGMPCLVCGTAVEASVLAGRNLFWCPECQRPGSAEIEPHV